MRSAGIPSAGADCAAEWNPGSALQRVSYHSVGMLLVVRFLLAEQCPFAHGGNPKKIQYGLIENSILAGAILLLGIEIICAVPAGAVHQIAIWEKRRRIFVLLGFQMLGRCASIRRRDPQIRDPFLIFLDKRYVLAVR